MVESDLEQILEWRNHPDVRRYMYTQHEITLSEHTNWYAKANNTPNQYLLIFELGGTPTGFINIKQLEAGAVADWGFYVAPGSEKGTGKKLGMAVLSYAFRTLKLRKICGQALAYNVPSVKFHTSLGFTQEGVLREQYFDGLSYNDVVHFGLLANEWKIIENKV
jgi:UDP-4-amino-4,6-dideoxy-N-acetyl-beta-L-altrosamine N-acetyltransferase